MNNSDLVIDVKHINKSFEGKPAVIDIALQVKRGEIFGFLGPNGSGKTTTIRMLCGLLVPDSGEGQCLGHDIITESSLIKQQVGYMTQRFSLYEELSIYENIDFIARIYGIPNRKQRIAQSIEELGLTGRQTQLAGTLSGGWKQRLALAAALIHGPQLLLLDEPTAGVDPKARRDFWEQIHRLAAKGITTLVSTHYMDEAERCHRLSYIAYGHMLVHGTVKEIIAQSNLTTWAVTGDNVASLSDKLQNLPGIEQITAFGNTLHISSGNTTLLEKTIAPFQAMPNTQWEKITPTLEDIFISLVAEEKDTRYG